MVMVVINWLNDNQGFAISVLTLIYVIATIVIVRYNSKTIKELQKTRDEESRPYIFAYLQKDPRDLCFFFRVKNYGRTGGIIDNISLTPNMKFVDKKLAEEFLKGIVLAPEQNLQFILVEKAKETSSINYDIKIEYHQIDSPNKRYSERYTLITQYSSQMGYVDKSKNNQDNEENHLMNIAYHLDSIRNKL